jgi:hypothetical protein
MNIFKSFTLKWWQGGMFKWGVLLLGIAIGANWSAIFSVYIPALLVIAVLLLAYITIVWLKQVNDAS